MVSLGKTALDNILEAEKMAPQGQSRLQLALDLSVETLTAPGTPRGTLNARLSAEEMQIGIGSASGAIKEYANGLDPVDPKRRPLLEKAMALDATSLSMQEAESMGRMPERRQQALFQKLISMIDELILKKQGPRKAGFFNALDHINTIKKEPYPTKLSGDLGDNHIITIAKANSEKGSR